jgi:hypothetical protein
VKKQEMFYEAKKWLVIDRIRNLQTFGVYPNEKE